MSVPPRNNLITRLINNLYNYLWIKKHGLKLTSPEIKSKKHYHHFMTVWLLNIDRMLSKLDIETEKYSFIDVGCGRGISTIYACRKYSFNKIYGFDFNQGLINDAITNVLEMKSCNSNDIVFFKADANSYILPNEDQVVFMFNPFDSITMKRFIENNIDTMRKNNVIIIYANSHYLDTIKDFSPRRIVEIRKYNCSVIFI
jgi:trans-aconitate methyltransferase